VDVSSTGLNLTEKEARLIGMCWRFTSTSSPKFQIFNDSLKTGTSVATILGVGTLIIW
jgi:hypothetical protein